jgi:succinate-semialdehyde dehydrogenase/glutarate-semialdehyde dehydrogenase
LRWNDLITEARDDLAQILVFETGKCLSEAYDEIDYALGFTWFFSGEAERIGGSVGTPAIQNRRVVTVKQPIGVTVSLVPWNFPIAMVLRKAAAAFAAGCSMIVKPSPEAPISCLALASLFERAGFPKGVLTILTTDLENTPQLSETLCKHPLVKKVSFTGSTRIGKLVAKHCSDGLKKITLELGGNCPFLIFDDADLKQALDALMNLKWRHAGQACIAANRVYVQSGIYETFAEMLVAETNKIVIGHGSQTSTTMGSMTTRRGLDKAAQLVEDAKKHGGSILTGGTEIENQRGFFFQPTIIGDSNEKMLITREEAFAPLCALYRFESEEEAVKAANDTNMGLASYFFTKNIDRSWRLSEALEAGMIGVNCGM